MDHRVQYIHKAFGHLLHFIELSAALSTEHGAHVGTFVQEADMLGGQGECCKAEQGVQVLQGLHEAAGRPRTCW